MYTYNAIRENTPKLIYIKINKIMIQCFYKFNVTIVYLQKKIQTYVVLTTTVLQNFFCLTADRFNLEFSRIHTQ